MLYATVTCPRHHRSHLRPRRYWGHSDRCPCSPPARPRYMRTVTEKGATSTTPAPPQTLSPTQSASSLDNVKTNKANQVRVGVRDVAPCRYGLDFVGGIAHRNFPIARAANAPHSPRFFLRGSLSHSSPSLAHMLSLSASLAGDER